MVKKKILVVEDEGLVAKDILNILENLGYDVSGVVSSGEEAVYKVAETQPDLVLMDILLKGDMDGVEAAKQIRKLFNIPVVYLTAYADEKTLQRAKITVPFGYILKPFEEKDLHSTIEMALYSHKMERALREREQWLSTVLRSIGDAVISTDINEFITFMNPIAEALTGWKKEEALGKDLKQVFNVVSEGHNPHIENPLTEGIWEGNIHLADQAVLIRKEGKKVPIDHSKSPVKDDKGNIVGSVLVFRDITEKKNSEEKLKQSWEKLQKAMKGTVHAMALTVEMRDPYTSGHQRRVSQIACAIAKAMNLLEDQIDGIRTAALIHDVGKIYVPAEILSKPSKLTKVEFSLIKTHSQVGYEILKPMEFPWPIATIVLQHHERMDGSGYPSGLKGKDLLLEAKILSVSDVVEAMSSFRPYRPALGIDKALEEISKKRGILYDEKVVDACLKIFLKKKFKFK